MIETLRIHGFKSIKQLTLASKKINILIGRPNSGKSNILEAIGLLSYIAYSHFGCAVEQFVRYERTSNLFHDEILEEPIEISADGKTLTIAFKSGRFEGEARNGESRVATLAGSHSDIRIATLLDDSMAAFKFYKFLAHRTFERPESDFLVPPSGDNLVSLLLKNKDLRAVANDALSAFGLRLGIRPQESTIEVIKQLDDIIVSYPYALTSETLQRLLFYVAAILSNNQSVLVFEEPESHAFPYYTKYLAEMIADDEKENQYFISTHNPYFLLPILEKTPKDQVAVHVTYFRDYQTKVRTLTGDQLQELLETDVFLNIERLETAE